jgi:hypothetical protein
MNKTDILNIALDYLGQDNIESFDSLPKDKMYLAFNFTLAQKELSQGGIWNVGYRSVKLDQANVDLSQLDISYKFAYIVPPQATHIDFVGEYELAKDFKYRKNQIIATPRIICADDGAKYILSNVDNAYCVYFKYVDDFSLLDISYVNALAYLIASKIAVKMCGITEGINFQNGALQFFNYYKGDAHAKSLNSQDNLQDDKRVPKFISARFEE